MSQALSIESHIEALKMQVQKVEKLLHDELKRPYPDAEKVHELKKKKLYLKEEMLKKN